MQCNYYFPLSHRPAEALRRQEAQQLERQRLRTRMVPPDVFNKVLHLLKMNRKVRKSKVIEFTFTAAFSSRRA